jgi:hypothetical protein
MNATSLGIVMRRLAAIAFVVVLAPMARGPVVDSATIAGQATGKHVGSAAIVLAQGRCFNGKCF